jgi:hypothetical protein
MQYLAKNSDIPKAVNHRIGTAINAKSNLTERRIKIPFLVGEIYYTKVLGKG